MPSGIHLKRPPPLHEEIEKVETSPPQPVMAMPSDEEWVTLDLKVKPCIIANRGYLGLGTVSKGRRSSPVGSYTLAVP